MAIRFDSEEAAARLAALDHLNTSRTEGLLAFAAAVEPAAAALAEAAERHPLPEKQGRAEAFRQAVTAEFDAGQCAALDATLKRGAAVLTSMRGQNVSYTAMRDAMLNPERLREEIDRAGRTMAAHENTDWDAAVEPIRSEIEEWRKNPDAPEQGAGNAKPAQEAGEYTRVRARCEDVEVYSRTSKQGRPYMLAVVGLPEGTTVGGKDLTGFKVDLLARDFNKADKEQGRETTSFSVKSDRELECWRGRGEERESVTVKGAELAAAIDTVMPTPPKTERRELTFINLGHRAITPVRSDPNRMNCKLPSGTVLDGKDLSGYSITVPASAVFAGKMPEELKEQIEAEGRQVHGSVGIGLPAGKDVRAWKRVDGAMEHANIAGDRLEGLADAVRDARRAWAQSKSREEGGEPALPLEQGAPEAEQER